MPVTTTRFISMADYSLRMVFNCGKVCAAVWNPIVFIDKVSISTYSQIGKPLQVFLSAEEHPVIKKERINNFFTWFNLFFYLRAHYAPVNTQLFCKCLAQ